MPRSSQFHTSLHRPRLILGIEKGSFGVLVMLATLFLVARLYFAMIALIIPYYMARWLSKKDDQFVAILGRYLMEEHVYDATPRPSDFKKRPPGWGKGLPL